VQGEISLDDLDERMKGHPRLAVRVAKGGRAIGSGELLPGHFADLEDGYRVGFAGLKRWSEIDVSRRSYRGTAVAGLAVAALGAVLWPLAAWRRW